MRPPTSAPPPPSLPQVLVTRELHPSPAVVGLLFAIAAAAAALGRRVTSLALAAPETGGLSPMLLASLGDRLAWAFAEALPAPFAVGAAWLAIDRIRTDEANGWLAPLAAGGASRARYLLGVAAGVMLVATATFGVALAAFVAGVTTVGGTGGADSSALLTLTGGLPLLLAATAYGAACATLTPRRALALALAGVLLPIAILTGGVLSAHRAPAAVQRLLVLHLPLFSSAPLPEVMARQALYAALLLTLTAAAARHRLGRCT
jgi:hypothetical protein